MTPTVGEGALIAACILAFLQMAAYLWLAWRKDEHRQLPVARMTALLQCSLLSLSFGALVFCYIDSDFSVANVAANSHSAKPLFYKITASWGNHEGSMLLWVWILSLYALGLSLSPMKDRALHALALTVQSFVSAGFLLFIIFTSNPFLRIFPVPQNGQDLNPILQDVGLAFHPPMLYLGYVGFSIVYSLSIAALILNRVDQDWAHIARPWVLFTWSCLGLGIGLGSWWAYRELGWGGWWFWDPVENASLLPWLAGTALLHSLVVLEKKQGLRRWVILLGILTFSLSLLGTFLVRSGIITSVHSFASDPARGLFILAYLSVICGGGFALYAWRATALESGERFVILSRAGAIIINNILLLAICGTVALGTLYPIGLELFADQRISVGAEFYNTTLPLMFFALLGFAGLSPYLAETGISMNFWRSGLSVALTFTAAATLCALALHKPHALMGLAGLAFGCWTMAATFFYFGQQWTLRSGSRLQKLRTLPARTLGMAVSHFGIGLLAFGIGFSSGWKEEAQLYVLPGATAASGNFSAHYVRAEKIAGPNYRGHRTTFAVIYKNIKSTLSPETRYYPVRASDTAEVDYRATPLYDIYAVTSQPGDNGALTLRLYYLPGMAMIWAGILLAALGGLICVPSALRKSYDRTAL